MAIPPESNATIIPFDMDMPLPAPEGSTTEEESSVDALDSRTLIPDDTKSTFNAKGTLFPGALSELAANGIGKIVASQGTGTLVPWAASDTTKQDILGAENGPPDVPATSDLHRGPPPVPTDIPGTPVPARALAIQTPLQPAASSIQNPLRSPANPVDMAPVPITGVAGQGLLALLGFLAGLLVATAGHLLLHVFW